MSSEFPPGFARAPAAVRNWIAALIESDRWPELDSLARLQCAQIARMRWDLQAADLTPSKRITLAREIKRAEEQLLLWDHTDRRRRYRVKRTPGDVRH